MAGSRGADAATRLLVAIRLAAGVAVPLDPKQSHYLLTVRRLEAGAHILLFNGRDGEWLATLLPTGKRVLQLRVEQQTREQGEVLDLWLLAAPIKGDRIDYIVEKTTELGISRFLPVITRRTVVSRINQDRLHARAREAAQQSERLCVPEVSEPQNLMDALRDFPPERVLVVCDETGTAPPIADALQAISADARPLAVLIGPEGGFAREELDAILKLPFAKPVSLGPRVLRADTAAIAAIATVQAILGDGRHQRRV